MTGVFPQHRNKSLGRWLKAAMLDYVFHVDFRTVRWMVIVYVILFSLPVPAAYWASQHKQGLPGLPLRLRCFSSWRF
jgi:hypothetical protein